MFREIPTSNRLLQKKWQDKNQEIHIKKLKEVRSWLNINKPIKNIFKKANFSHNKKEKLHEDRFKEIERENKILLQKMTRIMEGSISKHSPFEKGSLNKASRRKQLVDITIANHALLRRLQEKKSNYDVMKWEQDRVHNEQLAKRIALFGSIMSDPDQLKSKTTLPTLKNPRQSSTRMNRRKVKKNYETELQPLAPDGLLNTKRARTTRRRHKRTITASDSKGDDPKNLDITKACKIPEEREVLHQGSRNMQMWNFELEISKTKDKLYIVAVNKVKHSEYYVIDLELTKGEDILKEFSNDFNQISTNLEIISRRLVLLNPKLADEMKKTKKSKNKGKHLDKKSKNSASQPLITPQLDQENDQNALNTVEPSKNDSIDKTAFPEGNEN